MQLTWKASITATALHTALACCEGRSFADPSLADALSRPIDDLLKVAAATGCDEIALLESLLELSTAYDNKRQLAELALTRLRGAESASELMLNELAATVRVLEGQLATLRPELMEELALRARPLGELWAARGPGLLLQLAKLTVADFVVESAEVVLVSPCLGGFGRAHLRTNRVTLEAVLVDGDAHLPETVRLAWLLAQLNTDLPRYAEAIPHGQLRAAAQMATLPAVLAAAEYVEWTQCSPSTIALALDRWHCDVAASPELAEQLYRWWLTYLEGAASWQVAWRALPALLSASPD